MQDVVVPIYFGGAQGHGHVPLSLLHPHAPRMPRNSTFLFAGRICGDSSEPDGNATWNRQCKTWRNKGYSQGVRQKVGTGPPTAIYVVAARACSCSWEGRVLLWASARMRLLHASSRQLRLLCTGEHAHQGRCPLPVVPWVELLLHVRPMAAQAFRL